MPTVAECAAYLERFAPCATAAEWDNVGLLLGDPEAAVARVLTCLTLTPDVAEEAVREGANLIVSHHPVLFRGAKKLTANTPDGQAVLPLLRAGVAVYSPHTAFDNCAGGINDGLCEKLGVVGAVPLRPREAKRQCKLVVFVPDSDLRKVSDALFAAGAGVIGQYRECSFRLPGTGTFFGTDSTNPTVGQKGRREEAPEWRLEVVVPEALVSSAVAVMREAHSYEEPAFDVYPLKPITSGGEGRVGTLEQPTTLGELAKRAKAALSANAVQVVGDVSRAVRTVALACGAAGEFLSDAIKRKADVFLTGEVRFHDALAARGANVALVLPGHYATERPAVEDLAAKFAANFPNVVAWASRVERDPLSRNLSAWTVDLRIARRYHPPTTQGSSGGNPMSLRRVLMAVTAACGLCVWGFAHSGDGPTSAQSADPAATEAENEGTHDEAAARFRANQSRHWRQVALGSSTTH